MSVNTQNGLFWTPEDSKIVLKLFLHSFYAGSHLIAHGSYLLAANSQRLVPACRLPADRQGASAQTGPTAFPLFHLKR